MQTRNKAIIKIILFSMVLLNLMLTCIVLLPMESAQGANSETDVVQIHQPKVPQISPLQRIKNADRAAQKFWVGIFPFWQK
jgi:hypothetical protein